MGGGVMHGLWGYDPNQPHGKSGISSQRFKGEKERKKGVCAPLVWERGVAWHYRLLIDIAVLAMHAACLQVSGQASCCGSCTQHTCGACWWCARMHIHLCFSTILGAGFAPNTYQTTVQPKRFSLTLTFSIHIGNKLFWTTWTRSLQNTTLCMFSPIVTREHVC